MTDYVPVPCAEYDRYEVAIVRRRLLRLVWAEGEVLRYRRVRPLDLQTLTGEEFLVCRALDGVLMSIRLDHIRRAEPS